MAQKSDLDGISIDQLFELVQNYNNTVLLYQKINLNLEKKIRNPNLPEVISEKIIQLVLLKKYNLYTTCQKKGGDIFLGDIKIEVKAFTSKGPTSFGPTERWKRIYFLDAIDLNNGNIKIYEFDYANDSKDWLSIQINSKQTFGDQIKQKRRPRIEFSKIKYLPHKCIFDGSIEDLLSFDKKDYDTAVSESSNSSYRSNSKKINRAY